MDVHPYTPHKKHDEMLNHHRATWHGLTRLIIVAVIGVAALLVLMDMFLIKHS